MSFGKISQGSISSNRNSPQTRRAQHDAKRPQITAANTLADRKDNNTHDDKHARQLELLEHKRLEPVELSYRRMLRLLRRICPST